MSIRWQNAFAVLSYPFMMMAWVIGFVGMVVALGFVRGVEDFCKWSAKEPEK